MKNRKTLPSLLVAAPLLVLGGLVTSGCPDDGPEEELEDAADDVEDAVEDR